MERFPRRDNAQMTVLSIDMPDQVLTIGLKTH
jgi:hypothetical protein